MKTTIAFLISAVCCVALACLIGSWAFDKTVSANGELSIEINDQVHVTAYSQESISAVFASCNPFEIESSTFDGVGKFSQESTLQCSPQGEFRTAGNVTGETFWISEGNQVRVTMTSSELIWVKVISLLQFQILYAASSCVLFGIGILLLWLGLKDL